MDERRVGVLGAMSLVGESLLPLLVRDGWRVMAFSRRGAAREDVGVEWRQISPSPHPSVTVPCDALHPASMQSSPAGGEGVQSWICVAPIWVLPEHFSMLEVWGARRVVALSSTSVFVKNDSSDRGEQDIARRMAEGERALRAWAEARGVEWVILRPTLIYGRGRDKNITEIARFVRRCGFFPLLGRACGLRQPVHAEDVAAACVSALTSPAAANRTYNLSGGETLPYREMVGRVFAALGKLPRLVTVPLWMFRVAVTALHLLPRYKHWTAAMAERMNRDLVFDHADAARDLGFSPRPFQLSPEDLPA